MTLLVRYASEADWQELKRVRLAALRDSPTAFGVTHASATAYSDDAWRDRAAGRGPARYVLAFEGQQAVGIVASAMGSAGKPSPHSGAKKMEWINDENR